MTIAFRWLFRRDVTQKLLVASWLLFAVAFRAETTLASDAEPTNEETLALEYINRLRANPNADADRILADTSKENVMDKHGVDMEMFKREMSLIKPAPPLVFDLRALDAARKHNAYMIKNGQSHDETPGKDGFVAPRFIDRVKTAGYPAICAGEDIFLVTSGAWNSHLGFVVDAGPGGPGGMQPTRGHRANMTNPAYQDIGIGVTPYGAKSSVTHDFGSMAGRSAGGVIYRDKNFNRFYDPGEGVGGAKIHASDGAATVSWKSGAYRLELKTKDAVTLTAELNGRTYSRTFAAGAESIKFDWLIPEDAEVQTAEKLLVRVNSIADKNSPASFNARVELFAASAQSCLEPARCKAIDELTHDVGAQLTASKKVVRDALSDPVPETFARIIDEQSKPYRSIESVMRWFGEAAAVGNATIAFASFQKSFNLDKKSAGGDKGALARQLDATAKQLSLPEFSIAVQALAARARMIVDAQSGARRTNASTR